MDETVTSCIGIDPGGTCGLAFLDYQNRKLVGKTVMQVEWQSAQVVMEAMLSRYYADYGVVTRRFAGIEAFKTGTSAGAKVATGDLTRQLVFQFSQQLQMWGYKVQVRKAGDIKTWASRKRLEAATGIKYSDSLRHGWDGAMHGLYVAVHDAHMRDPLA